jgi:hypothetical protein
VRFVFFAKYAPKTTDCAKNESLGHFSATIESTQKAWYQLVGVMREKSK